MDLLLVDIAASVDCMLNEWYRGLSYSLLKNHRQRVFWLCGCKVRLFVHGHTI